MIEKLFPQIYTYQNKKYQTVVHGAKTDSEKLESVMNEVLKDAVFYQAIDDNGVVYGKTFYTTESEFENKFKKFNN